MKHTARFAKLTSTLILFALLPVTNALAQGEKAIVNTIPVGLISPNNLTITYVPLADIGTAQRGWHPQAQSRARRDYHR
jgi:hypothetical protein